MLGPRDGRDQAMAQMFRVPNLVEQPAGTWWKKNYSANQLQANPNNAGYFGMDEESSWSRNLDSAASMFPLPCWEEKIQDLSPYCLQISEQISSTMADTTKSLNCTVHDDELNTPEICNREFDYNARGNMSPHLDTSPVSLYERWSLPSLDVVTQASTEEDGVLNKPVEISEEQASETSKAIGSDICNNEGWSDEVPLECFLSPAVYEEEVQSTDDDDMQESENVEINQTVNAYETVNRSDVKPMTESMINTNEVRPVLNVDVESLIIDDDIISSTTIISSSNDDISLKSLLADFNPNNITTPDTDVSFIKLEPTSVSISDVQYNKEIQDLQIIDTLKKSTNEPSWVATHTQRNRTELKLNFGATAGFQEDISTPVLIDALLGAGDESSFKLLDFVQGEEIELKQPVSTVDFIELKQPVSTVDFSDLLATPSTSIATPTISTNTKTSHDTTLDVMMVKPVIIKKSPDGHLSISHKQDSIKEENEQTEIETSSSKLFTSSLKKATKKPEEEKDTILKANRTRTLKRKVSEKEVKVVKRSRGRPPKEPLPSTSRDAPIPSTSRGKVVSRPSRQRKTSFRSDYDYDDDEDYSPAKRTRLSSVESEGDKYRELRDRNNEASRKSRLNRKSREQEMRETAHRLEKENLRLKIKAEEMEKIANKLRQALIEAVAKGKSKGD